MAVVVPVIASWAAAAGAATAIAAGTATAFSYLAVAGAALTTIGAVSGKADVMKVGGALSLIGGLGSSFAGSEAAGADATLTSGSTLTDTAGTEAIGNTASDAWASNAMQQPVTGAAGMEQVMAEAGAAGAGMDSVQPFDYQSVTGGQEVFGDQAGTMTSSSTLTDTSGSPSLMERAAAERALTEGASSNDSLMQVLNRNNAAPSMDLSAKVGGGGLNLNVGQAGGPVEQAAGKLTWDDIGNMLKKTSEWANKNKEIVKIGGEMLSSMYGPQAERLDLEKSLMARRYANMNSPIALKFGS